MPTYSIPLGVPTIIAQNVVYATPARACYMSFSAAIEGSLDGTTWAAQPGSPGPGSSIVVVPFIRCTTGPATVVCKKL